MANCNESGLQSAIRSSLVNQIRLSILSICRNRFDLRFWIVLLIGYRSIALAQPLAFPGAEGFGRFTSGGRGGAVIAVTNLNDKGPGSLRDAIQTKGARTIVFRVSGTIALQSELIIRNGDLTIAGQTAPGDGICIRNYPLTINADNIIIRYIRVRLGDECGVEGDAISAIFQKNIIIDHCSFSWGTDEVASIRDNVNSTVQWCLISESLNSSVHHKGEHGYGGIWGGQGATYHHNLLAHHASRNPRFNGSRYSRKPQAEYVDFRNNVIYNWGFNSAYGGEGGHHNIIANYYKAGPASKHSDRIVEPWDNTGQWYIADNFVCGFPAITADNWNGGVQGDFRDFGRVDQPFKTAPVVTQSAEIAYELVLADCGANLPKRDPVDERIIDEVGEGIANFGAKGIINSQKDVGGWPELKSALPVKDDDLDGMADDWELAHNLNPTDPTDRNGDFNGDGYTNLEKYLNSLVKWTAQGGSERKPDNPDK